ncbi:biliverdin-producing heme oxygenase [Roseomonas sp. CAU 1739]|uniref:biliverdin-producing heme oxygenase n=1 Tax=Roseomonas sp. CAU 1739 TaxID=3140364 RepID=UPI00325C26B5
MPQQAATAGARDDGVARDALRHATGAIHERLHRIPALRRLAGGSISRSDYILLLRRLLAFHLVIEDRLARGPALVVHGIDCAERRRSGQLLDDLDALGAPAGTLPPLSLGDLPIPTSAGAAIGYLYVSEGSRLGGLALSRCLDGVLPPGGAGGRSFLLGYGAHHGRMWRALCNAIESLGATDEARSAMVAAAMEAFLVFERLVGADGDEQRPS